MASVRPRRSAAWFTGREYYAFARRAWLGAQGFADSPASGKPIIGIANTLSELNNCHSHFRQLADAVKRGVWQAGGFPLEFPTISLGEMFLKPTSMLLRNLMAMDVEEMIRAQPLDGVVLLGGCDKTIPAQLMGAISAGIPCLQISGGPMLQGIWKGAELSGGTDGRKAFDEHRKGLLPANELEEFGACLARSAGHCAVMGTASTMALMAEALGLSLPGTAAIPAVDARRYATAERAGQRIVEMVDEELTPGRVLSRGSFENAIRVLMAASGSTNAIVHLLAIAGRAEIALSLDDFDRLSRETPWILDVKPSGAGTMAEFFAAGGSRALLHQLLPLLDGTARMVSGRSVGEEYASLPWMDERLVRPLSIPLAPEGGLAVLRGNLAPRGAVIKHAAASARLMRHRGPAFVFENYEELKARIDDPHLPVTPQTVLVLKNAGPRGGPGFPEWGHLPLPKVLLDRGVDDMVRLSDARMSGTSFGTVVLHCCPESAAGGPLAAVETGDEIELDVPSRRLQLCVDQAVIERRLRSFQPPPPAYERGYGKLFLAHVQPADEGCDFDFLRP